jgi:hypothetical protein
MQSSESASDMVLQSILSWRALIQNIFAFDKSSVSRSLQGAGFGLFSVYSLSNGACECVGLISLSTTLFFGTLFVRLTFLLFVAITAEARQGRSEPLE